MKNRIGATVLVGASLLVGCSVSVDEPLVETSEQELSVKTQLTWARHIGTPEVDVVNALAVSDGAVYAAGQTFGSLTGPSNPGGSDAFLRKYDANGTIVWTREWESSDFEAAYAVVADASGVYVAGEVDNSFVTRAFLRKYSHSGYQLWESIYEAGNTIANGLAVDATGVYAVGRVSGAFPGRESAGLDDVYIRKLELATGREIWTVQFGTSEDDSAAGVFVNAGGVYLAGSTNGVFPGHSDAPHADAFVAKLNLNGTVGLWLRQFGSDDGAIATALSGDSTGIYVSTRTIAAPTITGELRRFDANGNAAWNRTLSAAFDIAPLSLSADSTGVYLAGYVSGTLPGNTTAGGTDVFVRRYDRKGKETWTVQLGTGGDDVATAIGALSSGIIIGGHTRGAWPSNTATGGTDGYVTKFRLATGPNRSRR